MICINCGSDKVTRDGDEFACDTCHYQWDVAHEQANAGFLKTQGRKPAESIVIDGVEDETEGDFGNTDPVPDLDALEGMKVEDLKALAAMQGIDLEGATKKSDIIARFFLQASNDEALG